MDIGLLRRGANSPRVTGEFIMTAAD